MPSLEEWLIRTNETVLGLQFFHRNNRVRNACRHRKIIGSQNDLNSRWTGWELACLGLRRYKITYSWDLTNAYAPFQKGRQQKNFSKGSSRKEGGLAARVMHSQVQILLLDMLYGAFIPKFPNTPILHQPTTQKTPFRICFGMPPLFASAEGLIILIGLFILSLKMNRSLTHKSTGKRVTTPNKLSPAHSPISANSSTLYFCHYKNAMYMGGIKSFKKDGKGILIHDCGLSVITNYLNDLMHGHNIFFSQHCLLSAEYVKGKIVDCVYRTDGYMAHLYYNSEGQLEGKCKLFNFISKTLTYASFRKGVMLTKEDQSDFTMLNKIFELAEYDFVIGRVHTSTLKYDIKKANNIEGQKYGNKLTIGFEKGGLINGLSFTLIFRGTHGGYNPETHRNEDEFELRVVERGYMSNSHLNGFGEKLFKNGNLYIGQFKNGVFQGNGILRNTAKKNWVSGYFQKGNLVDLLEYNNQGEQKKFDKIVEAMHERKANWINNEIVLVDMSTFDRDVQKILSFNPDSAVRSLEQRKQDVLKKIQDNFLCEPNSVPSFLETAKADLRMFGKEKDGKEDVKRFVHSFIPEVQKARLVVNDQNVMQDGYQLSSSRRSPTSIRKSKIFDRSKSFDRYLKTDSSVKGRIGKTPDSKKKIFNLSTAPSKGKQREAINQQSSIEVTPVKEEQNLKDSIGQGDSSNDGNSLLNIDRRERSFSKQEKDKSAGKSKIFKYLHNQTEQVAPKFIYTKIDTIKDSEKKKRLGADYQS